MLSSRGAKNVGLFDIPWKYAQLQTYDKETNPDGLISFAIAENVCIQVHACAQFQVVSGIYELYQPLLLLHLS